MFYRIDKKLIIVVMLVITISALLFACKGKDEQTDNEPKIEKDAYTNKEEKESNIEEGISFDSKQSDSKEIVSEEDENSLVSSEKSNEEELKENDIEKNTDEQEDENTISDEYEEDDALNSTQRNSINMLNYMTVLTQRINDAKGNQLFLESAYSSLVNDIYPNSVDLKTQAQITSLMDTIENYRMVAVKRKRLEFLYEQNKAQALRQAIPNPLGLLSVVESGNLLKSAVSVLYMVVD